MSSLNYEVTPLSHEAHSFSLIINTSISFSVWVVCLSWALSRLFKPVFLCLKCSIYRGFSRFYHIKKKTFSERFFTFLWLCCYTKCLLMGANNMKNPLLPETFPGRYLSNKLFSGADTSWWRNKSLQIETNIPKKITFKQFTFICKDK